MKKSIFALVQIFCFLSLNLGCEKVKSSVNSNCYADRKTIKIVENVKGEISILDSKHPDIWCIKSTQGIYNNNSQVYDTFDTVIPCELPQKFKKIGLAVRISGSLKDTAKDFKIGSDSLYYTNIYYGDLTKIETEGIK